MISSFTFDSYGEICYCYGFEMKSDTRSLSFDGCLWQMYGLILTVFETLYGLGLDLRSNHSALLLSLEQKHWT
jgi:hypothetical protein